MASKKKVYAVLHGRRTGVFSTWDECKKAVAGFSGAQFKSFETMAEAREYLKRGAGAAADPTGGSRQGGAKADGGRIDARIRADLDAGVLVAFTDGSYEHRKRKYAYGAVLVEPDGTQHTLRGSGARREFLESRNIAGEVLGVLASLDWARAHGYSEVRVYHDYQGLSAWAKGLWQAKTAISAFYVADFKAKSRGMRVDFQKVPAHCDVELNECADWLAKRGLDDVPGGCREGVRRDKWGAPVHGAGARAASGARRPKEREARGQQKPAAQTHANGAAAYAVRGATDLRKGVAALSQIVREAGQDPSSGAAYLFCSRKGDRVKVLSCENGSFRTSMLDIGQGGPAWPDGKGIQTFSQDQYKALLARAGR